MAVDEELHLQKKIVVDNYFNHLHLIHLNPSFFLVQMLFRNNQAVGNHGIIWDHGLW